MAFALAVVALASTPSLSLGIHSSTPPPPAPSLNHQQQVGRLPALGLDASKVTVSGLSGGAFFAVQMHVAYSSLIRGVGCLAGGPYYCARGKLALCESSCLAGIGEIDVDYLADYLWEEARRGGVDDPSNLKDAKVWVYSARQDTVVQPSTAHKAVEFYKRFTTEANIQGLFDHPGEHAFVTSFYGKPCQYLGTPYINDCGFDAAGSILQHVYDGVLPRVATPRNVSHYTGLLAFDQAEFFNQSSAGGGGEEGLGLARTGYVYIPPSCGDGHGVGGGCGLHVVFHGCAQYEGRIGDVFMTQTGYNAWADANDLVILYPQGCFDWWGFTGPDYATNRGRQMGAIRSMMKRLLLK